MKIEKDKAQKVVSILEPKNSILGCQTKTKDSSHITL